MKPTRRARLLKTQTASVAALVLLAALAAGCGSSGKSDSAKAPGNATDRAFVAGMVPHHRSAVEMAQIARSEATTPFVKTLSANIARTQKTEIARMQRVDATLADAGVKKGDLHMDAHMMGMNMDMGSLRGAKPFDAKFISMMIPHHQGAIPMSKAELAKGANPELRRLATSIIRTQEREIGEMRAHQ